MKRLNSLIVVGFSFLLMTVSVVNAGVSSNTLITISEHYAEIGKILKEEAGGNERQFIGYLNESAEKFLMQDFDSAKGYLNKAQSFLEELAAYLQKNQAIDIRKWQGPGTKATELFEIYGNEWSIVWQGSGQFVKISIYRLDDLEFTLVNSFHDHQGIEHIYEEGVFCLKIESIYKWNVSVRIPPQSNQGVVNREKEETKEEISEQPSETTIKQTSERVYAIPIEGYQRAKWGMSPQEVEQIFLGKSFIELKDPDPKVVGEETIRKTEASLTFAFGFEDEIANSPARISFHFFENQLYKVRIGPGLFSSLTEEVLMTALIEKYGNPTDTNHKRNPIWTDEGNHLIILDGNKIEYLDVNRMDEITRIIKMEDERKRKEIKEKTKEKV